MLPNELNGAMQNRAENEAQADVFYGRIASVLDLYRASVTTLLTEPKQYGIDFSHLVAGSERERRQAFTEIAETMLTAARAFIQVGEEYSNAERIKACLKLAPEMANIPGVSMDGLMTKLDEVCECGHPYGQHLNGKNGPCSSADCLCRRFKEVDK